MSIRSEAVRLANWEIGKARMSCDESGPFVTKKERRIHDRQYLHSRVKKRREYRRFGPDGMMCMMKERRAKSTKSFDEQEKHDNPGHATLVYSRGS